MLLPLHGLLLLLHATLTFGCSSRTIYKPRPPEPPIETTTAVPEVTTTTTPRPNITFPIFSCPPTYAAWYCLNDATCFSVEIHNQVLYNCECAIGFVGPRCEYKEIDGSYLPTRQRVLLEKASIVSGATLALLLMLLCCFMLYVRREAREKQEKIKLRPGECDEMSMESHDNEGMDEVDAICGPACSTSRMMPLRPFGPHHYKVLPMSAVFKR